jgi:hypothetical protein
MIRWAAINTITRGGPGYPAATTHFPHVQEHGIVDANAAAISAVADAGYTAPARSPRVAAPASARSSYLAAADAGRATRGR